MDSIVPDAFMDSLMTVKNLLYGAGDGSKSQYTSWE